MLLLNVRQHGLVRRRGNLCWQRPVCGCGREDGRSNRGSLINLCFWFNLAADSVLLSAISFFQRLFTSLRISGFVFDRCSRRKTQAVSGALPAGNRVTVLVPVGFNDDQSAALLLLKTRLILSLCGSHHLDNFD
jgi:hypothetical protein